MHRRDRRTHDAPEAGKTARHDAVARDRQAFDPWHAAFFVTYAGESRKATLPGYYPEEEGEGLHIGVDLQAADDALHSSKAG